MFNYSVNKMVNNPNAGGNTNYNFNYQNGYRSPPTLEIKPNNMLGNNLTYKFSSDSSSQNSSYEAFNDKKKPAINVYAPPPADKNILQDKNRMNYRVNAEGPR